MLLNILEGTRGKCVIMRLHGAQQRKPRTTRATVNRVYIYPQIYIEWYFAGQPIESISFIFICNYSTSLFVKLVLGI